MPRAVDRDRDVSDKENVTCKFILVSLRALKGRITAGLRFALGSTVSTRGKLRVTFIES